MTSLAETMTDPAPHPHVALWDRIARSYAARPVADPAAWEATLERVRAWLKPTDRVLELGCGTGSSALKLAPAARAYTGSDLSREMIAIAHEKLAGAGQDNLTFRVEEAGQGDGPWDAILAFNLMHLVPETEAAIAAIRDRLAPGGLFISKTGCLGRVSPLWPVIAAMRLIGKAPPVRFLSVRQYDAMIEAAGFEILETGAYPKRMNRFVVARKR
ncbi:class I SAM-dependent methyltransferase [Wenxinia saemankumensis]|uniref:Ubiquinone/menaquinone biosynthesis C-methylase UbiE n=1 Tax=Wenxinia saemankumensis TaxID=1447782 RepID=A0A1M6EVS7_9RHOB|nr:class I SAM-dependent methyltransferase [Wenxinia saemankumensis]SHI89555.1 Ubiquinone/menaquinone biosynthesis C-methylase UbiE [Wenxinia saemankumensis]